MTGGAGAQTHALIELPQPNDCYRVQLSMRLTGEMKVAQEGKPVKLKCTRCGHTGEVDWSATC